MNFCMSLNLNVFLELPRQQFKTVSAAARYLYVFNFGTTNSKIAFLHKNMEGSKDNLQTLKDLRDNLPDYLIMKEGRTLDGKILKGTDRMETISNPINNNMIKAYPSATNKAKAASLLRGKSITGMWFDEYAFLVYNDIIYMNAMPAFKTAADNARNNGAPYGVLITTTPGFMTEDCGKEAFAVKEDATKFDEQWYDFSYAELMELLTSNRKSDFVYIKYTYQQLGKDEAWFAEICKSLKNSWTDIRREILLEWATGVENSPFNEDDLDALSKLIVNPISTVYIYGKYRFDTYFQADTITYPPIMGVDVSGGLKKDSSTITIIDSRTTKTLGCMNNVIINVERNGVALQQISAYWVTSMFSGVNCYEVG
jgi:hypothetical protein